MTSRRAWVERITGETAVTVTVTLAPGACRVATGVGILDHLLGALAHHGGFGLEVEARGDVQVDAHHTVEDVGATIGQALEQALGDRSGVARFGFAYAPRDEALARAVVDLSGRPFCRFEVPHELLRAWVTPQLPITSVGVFWQAVAGRGKFTLHLDLERGVDAHHAAEALFRAAALALRQAVALVGADAPPAKGKLAT